MSEFKSVRSEEEVEMEVKAAAAGSQSALQYAAISESEKKGFREELAKYLVDMQEKVGSDGEKLVHVSEEFDTVAEAMTRQDLLSDETAPWSKYLLSNDRSFESTLGDAGRYDGVSTEVTDGDAAQEAKIRKEMARMELLEKQLRLASKKDAFVRKELIELEYEQEGGGGGNDDDDALSESSHASSTHSSNTKKSGKSNRSVLSRFNDYTFLTRAKSDRSNSRGSDAQSLPNSPMHSARSIESEPDDQFNEKEAQEDAKLSTPERMRVRGERRAAKQKAAEELKKKALKGRSALSDDEELRIQNLLDVDEGSKAWEALGTYGTASQKAALKSYDDRLRLYGRLHRFAEKDREVRAKVEAAASSEGKDDDDYLSTQRVLKDRTRQIARIENMIETVTDDNIDLSGLVDKEAPAAIGGARQRSLLQVPSFDSVKAEPGHKVTNADIARLLAELKDEDHELGHMGGENVEPQSENDEDHDDDVSRQQLDRLLSGLRPEIDRLGNLRNALHEVMRRSTEKGLESSMKNNGDIQRALMDLDDELVDVQNRYGTTNRQGPKTNIAGKTLQPMSEQGDLHSKLHKLRDRMAERGVYQQDYIIGRSNGTDDVDDAPPLPAPAAGASKIGLDPRFRIRRPIPSAEEDKYEDEGNEEGDEYAEQEIPTTIGGSPGSPGRSPGRMQGKLVI